MAGPSACLRLFVLQDVYANGMDCVTNLNPVPVLITNTVSVRQQGSRFLPFDQCNQLGVGFR